MDPRWFACALSELMYDGHRRLLLVQDVVGIDGPFSFLLDFKPLLTQIQQLILKTNIYRKLYRMTSFAMLDIGNDLQNTVSKRTATFVHHWHHYLYHLLTPTHKHSVICPFIHTLLDMPPPPYTCFRHGQLFV